MSSSETTDPRALLRYAKAAPPSFTYAGRKYGAVLGSLDEVRELVFDICPLCLEDDGEADRIVERINELQLVVAHRFEGGRAVEFLYSPELLRSVLLEGSET